MEGNGKEPRTGVYVCHCGTNIASVIDVAAVAEYAAALPHVVVARDDKYMCSDPGQDLIVQDIAEHNLNRVVVASCSPSLHEATFRGAVARGGLNPFCFQMVNIREHNAWVHTDGRAATEKAKAQVRGAIGRVALHRALEPKQAEVHPDALVVGAGIAGIQSALTLAKAGKKVYLVERQPSIGGHMAQFDKTFPTLDCAACILTPKMTEVGNHPNIQMLSYSEVEKIDGYVGNFKAAIKRKARYVKEDKCTGCGQCIERCPVHFAPQNGVLIEPPEPKLAPEEKALVDRSLDAHRHERGPLVSVLQDINLALGFLPPEALRYTALELELPLARVYHVATFYTAFSLVPRGEHVIKVCMGTACHVRGGARILETLESRLEMKAGETTPDMKFTLETVNCLGACALAPVMTIDGYCHGQMTPMKITKLLKEFS